MCAAGMPLYFRAVYVLIATGFALACSAANLPRPSAVPGGVALVRVGDATEVAPQVFFAGTRVWVTRHDHAWFAVVGLPFSIQVGAQSLDVHTQASTPQRIAFNVREKKYPTQKLTITNKAMVDPPDAVQDRIKAESKHIAGVRSTFSPNEMSDAHFDLPARGPLSSRYGLARVLNGKPRAPHAGLDLAIPTGTIVTAAADGVLIDADDYYYCGKTAFIDHGNGLISMYCHLSEWIAKVGEPIKRGQPIGKSGATGRVTGPHLHWSVYLNGSSVDPELFLPATKPN
jgi:murein DD-endopeptidase MepM/ murein hydrolase activator NlpD